MRPFYFIYLRLNVPEPAKLTRGQEKSGKKVSEEVMQTKSVNAKRSFNTRDLRLKLLFLLIQFIFRGFWWVLIRAIHK